MSDRRNPTKRLLLTEAQTTLVEQIRDEVKTASEERDGEELQYAYGVIDALAFVWAGMPMNAADLYGPIMGAFSALCKEAGL